MKLAFPIAQGKPLQPSDLPFLGETQAGKDAGLFYAWPRETPVLRKAVPSSGISLAQINRVVPSFVRRQLKRPKFPFQSNIFGAKYGVRAILHPVLPFFSKS